MSLWIQLHTTLTGHAKTRQLATLLNIPRTQAIGHLVAFWTWAIDHAPQDGAIDLNIYPPKRLAEAALWPSSPESLLTAMVNAGHTPRTPNRHGFLELTANPSILVIHNWPRYTAGLYAAKAPTQPAQSANCHSRRPTADAPVVQEGSSTGEGDLDPPTQDQASRERSALRLTLALPFEQEATALLDLFREIINPNEAPTSREEQAALASLALRLQQGPLDADEIELAMRNFAADGFCVHQNAHRGLKWWCEDVDRLRRWQHMEADPESHLPRRMRRHRLTPASTPVIDRKSPDRYLKGPYGSLFQTHHSDSTERYEQELERRSAKAQETEPGPITNPDRLGQAILGYTARSAS